MRGTEGEMIEVRATILPPILVTLKRQGSMNKGRGKGGEGREAQVGKSGREWGERACPLYMGSIPSTTGMPAEYHGKGCHKD